MGRHILEVMDLEQLTAQVVDGPVATDSTQNPSTAVPVPVALEVVPLLEPADGIPDVIQTLDALADVVAAFAAGTGPVAVDAERASGYRYG